MGRELTAAADTARVGGGSGALYNQRESGGKSPPPMTAGCRNSNEREPTMTSQQIREQALQHLQDKPVTVVLDGVTYSGVLQAKGRGTWGLARAAWALFKTTEVRAIISSAIIL